MNWNDLLRAPFYPSRKKISASFPILIDHIWRAWYNSSYTITAKPIKMLELHYPMIQFLMNSLYTLIYTHIHLSYDLIYKLCTRVYNLYTPFYTLYTANIHVIYTLYTAINNLHTLIHTLYTGIGIYPIYCPLIQL